ncbi:hypothetical protein AMELA_G00232620 [Ameiurus melas]|uniref:Galectin n=1 Tax=Ameiurus melas TaxID=219545 RepID=A0A7J6A1E1_AMEME|nr:hypothetical protein AMELA_G00232620 [Ameiurus melas]
MKQNISLFTSFLKANKNEKRIKFIIASISDPSNPGTSIRLYQKSVLTDPRFQPVSKPPPPVVQTSDEKVLLKLSKSPTGETVRFRVEYRTTPPTDLEDDIDEWTVTDTSDAQTSFTLTGLKPANQYWVRYRAVSDVGVSEASNSVPFSTDPKLSVKVGHSWVDDDIAFHFNPRISGTVVQNSRRNGWWENEEHISWCPIPKGSAFDVFIVTKSEGYEVYVNGQRHCLFKHRMPMEKVASLYFAGDVMMNTVGIVRNWNTSTFGKELNSGTSRTKLLDIQSDVPHPVCNPSKPYLGSIPGGLRPGVALFFQGVVPSDCERFEINLQTGPQYLHDIALHFNPRLNSNSVVCNSCRDGRWDENYIETPGGPFVKGGAFDIIMVVKPEGYEVMVNGLEYCTYNHRIPVDKVTTLDIRGDVFMNTFGIIEVENVNLKVTIPANI